MAASRETATPIWAQGWPLVSSKLTPLVKPLNFLSQEHRLAGWKRKASRGQLGVWSHFPGVMKSARSGSGWSLGIHKSWHLASHILPHPMTLVLHSAKLIARSHSLSFISVNPHTSLQVDSSLPILQIKAKTKARKVKSLPEATEYGIGRVESDSGLWLQNLGSAHLLICRVAFCKEDMGGTTVATGLILRVHEQL